MASPHSCAVVAATVTQFPQAKPEDQGNVEKAAGILYEFERLTALTISELAFTMYPVTDMERSLVFYRDALGLPPGSVATENWYEFDVGGQTFGIGNFEQVGTPGTAQSLALEVDDLATLRSRLKEHGVDASEPHDLQFCAISVVKDPDGNQVWLHQRKPR